MIIRSLLDTDLYKFTMMQVVLHHFPAAQVGYRFKCRTPGIDLTPYLDLSRARRRLTLFLAQYWGGPTTYSDERGHPRLRARHA